MPSLARARAAPRSFGNWSEVAASLGSLSEKSGAQCSAHYSLHFLCSSDQLRTAALRAAPLSAEAEAEARAAWQAGPGAALEAEVRARREAAFRAHVDAVGAPALAYGALSLDGGGHGGGGVDTDGGLSLIHI